MLAQLSIEELVKLIYEIEIAQAIFFFFVVFVLVSLVRTILVLSNIALTYKLALFDVDEKSIPTLLFISWFSLFWSLVDQYTRFESFDLTLVAVVIFLLFVGLIRLSQYLLPTIALKIRRVHFLRNEPTFLVTEDRAKGFQSNYLLNKGSDYRHLILNLLLILYCQIYALLELTCLSAFIIALILFIYTWVCVFPTIRNLWRDLNNRTPYD